MNWFTNLEIHEIEIDSIFLYIEKFKLSNLKSYGNVFWFAFMDFGKCGQ